MRTKLIAANWKMNTSLAEAHVLADGVRNGVEDMDGIEVVLCPPTIWLSELSHNIPPRKLPHLHLGAQNVYFEEQGAFTGETSPAMAREVAEYVVLGHSERTHIFGETTELVARKTAAAFAAGLTPIVCIGEDVASPDSKRHLVHQLEHLFADLTEDQIRQLVIAYEPVWAIGSGNPATPEYAQDVIEVLRQGAYPQTRILYGGSVTAENAKGFLEMPDIDGFLIGGTSLKLKPFLTICQYAEDISTAHA